MRHANISIFVPHLGCPNDCSFCNQRYITGQSKAPTVEDVDKAVHIACNSKNYDPLNTEIAFFGGSFTAIDREYMITLLNTAGKYVSDGKVRGIRISTRPDCIDTEILTLLKEYGVTAIELGAQSLDDRVLRMNHRGHSVEDVYISSNLIKNYKFELGLQMMTGLYGDTDEGAVKTAEQIVKIRPDTVRIYPTIVLKNTTLSRYYQNGVYQPQSLENAVNLCVGLINMFNDSGIRVIRTGLHSIDNNSYVAGPWHPAFSELCDSVIFYNKIISQCKLGKRYEIYVNPADISKVIGQKRSNSDKLSKNGYNIKFIQDNDVERYTIKCREVN